jgi:NADPH2:quinone reductase
MKFVHVKKPGGPEELEIQTMEQPKPSATEVLIQVKAAGVNRPDIAQRNGSYPPPPGASLILGLEVSGVVQAVGSDVKSFKIGDAVCALTSGGGYAEFCVAPATQCLPVPKNFSFEAAAGIPENYFTVWSNVFDRGRLQAGENFLVHGGTSGIGLTAIQLAKSFGARVLTTAGSLKKCEAAQKYGADLAVNYKTEDFVTEVKKFTHDEGVNVILDMIGGAYFQKNLDCLAPEGRLVQIALQQGNEVQLKLAQIMSRRLTVTGSTLRPRSAAEKAKIAAQLQEKVWPLLESGKIQVVIDQVFPFEKVAEAHRLLESSVHIGKIILRF